MGPVPRPTIRGVAALAAFGLVVASAAATGTLELAPLAVVIGIPLLVAPWLVLRRARRAMDATELHAHAEPAAAEVGSTMEVVLSLTNRANRGPAAPSLGLPPVEGQWLARGIHPVQASRRVPWLAPALSSLVGLPSPEPGTTRSCRLPVPTGRRGILELPPRRCWAHDPLGLFGAPGPLTPHVVAVVHPAPLDPGQPVAGVGAARAGQEVARDSSSGRGLGDLEGIRPYVPGDRLSLLHWPAKARYGTWFVRQFGAEGAAAVPLVLDDRAGVHRKAEFERLVSATLWALEDSMRDGHPVLFLTLSGRSVLLEPTERGRADAWLVLAGLQPSALGAKGLPSLPNDAVLLTTRTGAERLSRPSGLGPDIRAGDGRSGPSGQAARLVVV